MAVCLEPTSCVAWASAEAIGRSLGGDALCILGVYFEYSMFCIDTKDGSRTSVLFLVVCYSMCMCIWFVTSILCCICPELALCCMCSAVYRSCHICLPCQYAIVYALYFCNVLHMIISLPWMLYARTYAICLICSVQHACLCHVIYICTEWWMLHSCTIQCIYTALAFFL